MLGTRLWAQLSHWLLCRPTAADVVSTASLLLWAGGVLFRACTGKLKLLHLQPECSSDPSCYACAAYHDCSQGVLVLAQL